MDIRRKTLLALGITFVVLLCIIAGVSVFLYVDQLGRLEQQVANKEVTEVIGAISNEKDDLSKTLHDWSYWDETYKFALDQNPDYIIQNLNETSLSALGVHLFMVTDPKGNIIYGKILDPLTGRETTFPEHFNQFLPPGHPFLNFTSLSGTNTGILLLPTGPMMIASSPVLNNRKEGPYPGVLVMGRSINELTFTRISRVTGNPISVHWNGDGISDGQQLSLLQQMNPDSAAVSIPRSDDLITGYKVINDINGQRILIVTDQPRDLYQNGFAIIKTYLVIFIFTILVTLVIVLFVVDQTILKRLNLLTNRVRNMGQDHNDDMKPELTGSDEIAHLEQAILSANTDLKNSEQKLRKISTSLAVSNKKLNLLFSITRHDINNQLTVILGYMDMLEYKEHEPALTPYFQSISTAAQRIAAMIRFTKEYENIGANVPVWQDCRTLADTSAKQSVLGQVVMKNDIPAGMEVYADPLIAKVCDNLIDNAVRHGGKITTIRFSVEEHESDHVVVCEDDGDGIPAGEKEKIFDRGFRISTGFGLAISREILSITGITLRETGETGKGARFEITVPKGAYRIAVVK